MSAYALQVHVLYLQRMKLVSNLQILLREREPRNGGGRKQANIEILGDAVETEGHARCRLLSIMRGYALNPGPCHKISEEVQSKSRKKSLPDSAYSTTVVGMSRDSISTCPSNGEGKTEGFAIGDELRHPRTSKQRAGRLNQNRKCQHMKPSLFG